MNVSVVKMNEKIETEDLGDTLRIVVTVDVNAINEGDPGSVVIFVQVFDDMDDVVMDERERIHLDNGESKNLTFNLEEVVPEDTVEEYRYSSIYVSVSSIGHTPD
jgi:hypothetical protein